MANTGDIEDGSAQLPRHPAVFSSDMDVPSVSYFLGDNGISSDVCEIFEGYYKVLTHVLAVWHPVCICISESGESGNVV